MNSSWFDQSSKSGDLAAKGLEIGFKLGCYVLPFFRSWESVLNYRGDKKQARYVSEFVSILVKKIRCPPDHIISPGSFFSRFSPRFGLGTRPRKMPSWTGTFSGRNIPQEWPPRSVLMMKKIRFAIVKTMGRDKTRCDHFLPLKKSEFICQSAHRTKRWRILKRNRRPTHLQNHLALSDIIVAQSVQSNANFFDLICFWN